ncbi:MAG: hypothetical protein KF773_30465 [Deltaproteobacteria bacterium]|nr:hypothetical protein [Deltaproteobacteria bacterium]
MHWTSKVDKVLATIEVMFVKNSVRARWNGEDVPVKINQTAKGAGLTVDARAQLEKACKCKVGTDSSRPVILLFNNTGDETGDETNPVAKLAWTAPHELLHIVLPEFGGDVLAGPRSSGYHHGLTDYLGIEGGTDKIEFRPGKGCVKTP